MIKTKKISEYKKRVSVKRIEFMRFMAKELSDKKSFTFDKGIVNVHCPTTKDHSPTIDACLPMDGTDVCRKIMNCRAGKQALKAFINYLSAIYLKYETTLGAMEFNDAKRSKLNFARNEESDIR